ncbi:MAG: MotA/TolQ/ExbB proton channel family protein [Prolixibacteraceae bacterium]|jgi:biopolymer transport protein ExbB|nr:MotA/TolQ/ExbB proton channel family protein [Prolixibacteraceae bacterium]MDI9564467.1 MotA/TolQ/ExbB proton channel family protein [Bacteroidota bacterium]NLT00785.1 MotA/TolQ/ExbB proton channel family protein [Bacteroidales bacterium]OQB79756.1 MAG: colicin uptake protein TolQ [Bacteroidetes bacterium ADurb.Bin123]HNU77897.1 MotA/TolQ/ExbB proton channel family protein [Prolixibacteraceae bacterium]
MVNILLQIQTVPAGTNNLAAQPDGISMKFIDLAMKGGWIMIPILLLSVLAVYIFVDRYFAVKRAGKFDTGLMDKVKSYITAGKIDAAIALCRSSDNPAARMVEKGISRLGRPLTDVTAAIENVGNLEIQKLEKGLPALASAAGGAPMLGFLGTVTGMVQAFYDMANAGNNIDITLLSTGIYQALVTTVAGLIVGIIAYFAYNILVSNIEKVVFKMEATTTEFMDLLNEPA